MFIFENHPPITSSANSSQLYDGLTTSIRPIISQLNSRREKKRVDDTVNEEVLTREEAPIDQYLKSLIEKQDGLVLLHHDAQSHFRLPIDKLYVALTVDTTAHSERNIYIEELNQHLQAQWRYAQLFPPNIHYKLMQYCQHLETQESANILSIDWDSLLLTPHLLSAHEQTTAFTFLDNAVHEFDIQKRLQKSIETNNQSLNLAEAYNDFTHMVILGDPGSGKSTLLRWLSVNMAKAYLANRNQLDVPKYQVDPKIEQKNNATITIGKMVRIPIFITIAEYAQFCEKNVEDNSLDAFLRHKYPEDVDALTLFLKRGQCLIMLDGFDETAQRENRQAITNNIHDFLDQWFVEYRKSSSTNEQDRNIDQGNRFFITSRIAGNYTSILREDFIRVTIEPLNQKMVKLFFQRWFDALNSERGRIKHPSKYAVFLSRLVSNDPHLNALVKTPQLATVVAHVYVSQNYQLPRSKVGLYQAAIENFSVLWSTRLQDRSLFPADLSQVFIAKFLQQLAYEAHRRSGPINELFLGEMITYLLKHFGFTEQQIHNHVKTLLTSIAEEVGLIIPHGINTFQFIHRQFQEYLAARDILSKLDISIEIDGLLHELLHDINWQEPLRLALECLSEENPTKWLALLHRILENSSSQFSGLPLTSYMLTDLLNNANYGLLRENLGAESLQIFLDALLKVITQAYGIQWENNCKGMMQHTYVCLAKIIASEFQPIFVSACAVLLSEESSAPALSRLLLDARYTHQQFIIPLQSLLRRKILTSYNNAVSHLLQYHHNLIINRDLTTKQSDPSLIIHRVEFLLASPWINQLNHFSALITCVPAFDNQASTNHYKVYLKKANLLSLSEVDRMPMLPLLDYDWGDDCIYNIAVFLDTIGGKKANLWDEPARYDPKYIFLENNNVFTILEAGHKENISTVMLAKKIEQHYMDAQSMLEKTTSLISLIGLGYNSEHLLNLTSEIKLHFIAHLQHLQEKFQHIIYRAHYKLIKSLSKINTKTQGQNLSMVWSSFLDFFTHTTGLSFMYRPHEQDKSWPHMGLLSYLVLTNLTGKTDEASNVEYNISNALNKFNKTPAQWLQIFNYFPLVAVSKVSGLYWPIDRLPLHAWDWRKDFIKDISWQLLNLFIRLPRSSKRVYKTLMTNLFAKSLENNSNLAAELIIITKVVYQADPAEQKILIHQINKTINIEENWVENIAQCITDIVSPYYRARAWLRLALSQGNQQSAFFYHAYAVTQQMDAIENKAELQILLAENCALVLLKEQAIDLRIILVEQALSNIRQLQDAGQKSMLLIRCALLLGDYNSLILESLHSLLFLEEESRRAEHARLLLPLWKTIRSPELISAVKLFYEQFSNTDYACYAAGQNKEFVEKLVHILIAEEPEPQKDWIPFLACARIQDCLEQFNASKTDEQKWLDLLYEPTLDNAARLLRETEGNYLDFSLTAALVLDQLQQQDQLALESIFNLLLPILNKPTGETLPILTRWLIGAPHSSLQKLLAKTALLLICEMNDCFYPIYFSEAVTLLSSPFDSWRQRTTYLFRGSNHIKYPLTRAVSVLGKETYYNLVKHFCESVEKNPEAYNVLYTSSVELYQDDPESAQHFINLLDTTTNDELIKIAKIGITNAEHASPAVVNMFIDQFARVNSVTQREILIALSTYIHLDSLVSDRARKALNKDRLDRFCSIFKSIEIGHIDFTGFQSVNLKLQCEQLIDLLSERKHQSYLDYHELTSSWMKKGGVDLVKLQKMSNTEIANALREWFSINITSSHYLKEEKTTFKLAAQKILQHKISIEIILNLLVQSLISIFQQRQEIKYKVFFLNLLGIFNQLAELLPWQISQYLRQIVQNQHMDFPSYLLKFMQTQTSSSCASLVIELFAYIPPTQFTLDAIFMGLRISENTLVSVTKTVEKISFHHQISNQLVERLLVLLESDSVITAYIASELLVKIALSEMTKPDMRQAILFHFESVFKKIESQRFLVMRLFLTSVSDIPTLANQLLKGMMKIIQLPNYSHDHQKKLQRLHDEANISAIKEGDTIALAQYLQQHPHASWKDDAIVAALNYAEQYSDSYMLDGLLASTSLLRKFGELIAKAAESDNLFIFKQLQEKTPEHYNAYDEILGVFVLAVEKRNAKLCKFLLDQGASINHKNAKGISAFDTLFIDNLKYYSDNICQRLLCHQPDTSFAETVQDLKICKYKNAHELLVTYHQCQQTSEPRKQLLFIATEKNFIYIIDEILDQDNLIDQVDFQGNTLLLIALQNNHEVLAEKLIERGANVSQQNTRGENPLLLSVKKNLFDLCRIIIEKDNACINSTDSEGNSALYYAATYGYADICELLLKKQADANQHNTGGKLALHSACENNHLACVKYLLPETNNIDQLADNEVTCLQLAILQGLSLELIKLLIEHGASLTHPLQGMSLGTLAYIRGKTSHINYLTSLGVEKKSSDIFNISPSCFIIAAPSRETLLLGLDELGVDLSAPGLNGETWLIAAIKLRCDNAVSILLKLLVDPRVPNRQGETALVVAKQYYTAADPVLEWINIRISELNVNSQMAITEITSLQQLVNRGHFSLRERERTSTIINRHASVFK